MHDHSLEIERFIREAVDGTLSVAAVDAYCQAEGVSLAEVCNAVALAIARRFDDSAMAYEDADTAMNALYSVMIQEATRQGSGFALPEPALAIYLAFDAGEYERHDGEDPVERYTRPLVKKVLASA